MASTDGPSIITDRLILNLDAANLKSVLYKIEVLVVAGGGGGGANHAGGGGGGGLIYNSDFPVISGTAYTVTVGAGGSRSTSYTTANGTNGGNSVFGSLTAVGGGYGGNRRDGGTAGLEFGGAGGSGGGGGGQGSNDTPTNTGGTGTSGQGFAGGTGSFHAGAGGGGAGGPGETTTGSLGGSASTNFPGDGGIGKAYTISGTLTYYAGGGGGGGFIGGPYAGAGGLGGGGAGQIDGSQAVNGVNGTGGGGGGANGGGNANGGNGGSGIVIIRYPGPQKATGGTITSSGNFTVHTFTTSGTFTPGTNWGDVSGFNYTGVLTNGPAYNSANNGYFSFDGVNDYVSLPSSVGAFGTGNFTINCWWKSSGTQSNYVAIMEQGFTGSPSNGAWAFKITHNTSIINFTYYNGGIVDNLSSVNINDGTWHNYVAVRSGTNLTLYVDGVSRYSLTLPTSYSFGEGSPVFVGYNPRDGTYINGSLPILSVYTRALSVTEVQQNFNAQRTRYGI